MLLVLAEIESAYNDKIEEVRAFRNKGPFAILDKIQAIQIQLQNLLFQNMSIIDADIKTICPGLVWSQQDALNMKEKLELSNAMIELADNKISKTHDHDIANRIIDMSKLKYKQCEASPLIIPSVGIPCFQNSPLAPFLYDEQDILTQKISSSSLWGMLSPISLG